MGGMAEVFLAQTAGPMGFSKALVVKRILPQLAENTDFVTMFLNEARLAALLNHANVVQIFDLGSEGSTYYLAMELIDGPNLRDLNRGAIAVNEVLPLGVALKVISLACEGLAYAHEFVDPSGVPLRLVHRDISPHNILLSRSGNVKVADFGIAKAASIPSVTRTGQIKGKLKYMSPEQLRDEPLDMRSDVWAMGVTLYEVLTGARPFNAPNDAGVIAGIISREPIPLAEHGVESAELLQPIIDRALAKPRADRYADARALQTDLETVLIQRGAVVRGLEIAQAIGRFCPTESKSVSGESPARSGPRVPSRSDLAAVGRVRSQPRLPAGPAGVSGAPTPPPARAAPAAGPGREFSTERERAGLPEELDSTSADRLRALQEPPPAAEAPPASVTAVSEVGEDFSDADSSDVGPVLTNMGRPTPQPPPEGRAKSQPADGPVPSERRSTDALPVRVLRATRPAPVPRPTPKEVPEVKQASLWDMVGHHPVAAGLLVGAVVVAVLMFALVVQLRALR